MESAEDPAAQVSRIGSIDRPDVDILLLRALDGRVKIRALRPESPSAKIVDSRRDQENRVPVGGRRPALHQIQNREIRAGKRTPVSEGQAQSLAGNLVVVGEVLC